MAAISRFRDFEKEQEMSNGNHPRRAAGLGVAGVLVALCGLAALGVAQGAAPAMSEPSMSKPAMSKPSITKIDPPNWFAAIPAPMLLIEGTELRDATVTVAGAGVKVLRTERSANGHWATVWLDTGAAGPEMLTITAKNAAGSVSAPYALVKRRVDGPQGFSAKDVLYLVMPDRFADGDAANNRVAGSPDADRNEPHAYHGGDLQGVIDHLDYLQAMGVTAVWLTPVLANNPAGRDYHGYGATDMYAVEPRLGTLATYRKLGEELHRRHMKLVFDDVPNHVGPANVWVADPPAANWFHGTKAQHLDNQYVFNPVTDPHAPVAASLDAEDGWFVNVLPDLNQQNPLVAQYLTENMIWWIEEAGIDGLRIDTFPYVQREFWQEYLGTLNKLYPGLTSIGEVTTPDPTVNAYFEGGRTLAGADTHLTTPFDYPMYYALVDVLLKGRPMSALEENLRQDWLYPHADALVPFFGNHDQMRFMSRPGATPALLRMGFGLVMTMRGMPQLYAGDELAMEGGEDPDNRRDFPGGFAGDAANAFTAEGRTPAQNQMHDWVAGLGRLRGHSAALESGTMQTLVAGKTSFAYVRTMARNGAACSVPGSLLVVMSREAAPAKVEVPVAETALAGCGSLTPVLGDGEGILTMNGPKLTVALPAFGFAIFTLR